MIKYSHQLYKGMGKMRKVLLILLCFVLCIGIFVACDSDKPHETETEKTSTSGGTENGTTLESDTLQNTDNAGKSETAETSESTETAKTTESAADNTPEATESIETDDTKETTTETSESSHPVGHSLAKFEFGDNGEEKHSDGSKLNESNSSFTSNGYTLTFTNFSKVYINARDSVGNSVLKLGTSEAVAGCELVVGDNVNSVVIKIARYKTYDTVVNINGKEYTLTKNSNDGEYDVITIDTSSTKKITLTTVAGNQRCMIDSIEFVG